MAKAGEFQAPLERMLRASLVKTGRIAAKAAQAGLDSVIGDVEQMADEARGQMAKVRSRLKRAVEAAMKDDE